MDPNKPQYFIHPYDPTNLAGTKVCFFCYCGIVLGYFFKHSDYYEKTPDQHIKVWNYGRKIPSMISGFRKV